jgi:hypothetical protein
MRLNKNEEEGTKFTGNDIYRDIPTEWVHSHPARRWGFPLIAEFVKSNHLKKKACLD